MTSKKVVITVVAVAIVAIVGTFFILNSFLLTSYVQVANVELSNGQNIYLPPAVSFTLKNVYSADLTYIGIKINDQNLGPYQTTLPSGQTHDYSYYLLGFQPLMSFQTYDIQLTFTMADGKYTTYTTTYTTPETSTNYQSSPDLYTLYEKVEISSATVDIGPSGNGWVVTLGIKNTGSADATIDNVLINARSYSSLSEVTVNPLLSVSLAPGSSRTLSISIPSGTLGCASGTTIEMALHSAAGKTYPQMVTLT